MPRNRPEIDVEIADLETITGQAWSAIEQHNDPPYLFCRGEIVRLQPDDYGRPKLKRITPDILRHEMARAAHWIKMEKDKKGQDRKRDARPPMDVVKDALAIAESPLPVLHRITEVPVFTRDGSLPTEPGYHPPSKNYLAPAEGLRLRRVAKKPFGQIWQARSLVLDELLLDFPFVHQADKAHAMALLLLPFARDLIDGPTPNHLVEAPTPGSGKGLLADVLLMAAMGRRISVMAQAESEEEWRKRITAKLREGAGAILIDNLTKQLDSGALAAALTAESWTDRLLGKNESLRLPVRCAFVTTANNPQLSTEMARRCIRIRLDPQVERPWRRKEEFKHPNLRVWAWKNRARLVWAAHTLIRAWLAHGRPEWKGTPLGSYESWSAVMGGILQLAEIGGFLGNLDEFYEVADLESAAWGQLVERWWEKFSLTEVKAADLLPIALEIEGFGLDGKREHAQKVAFGGQLTRKRDCVIAGHRIYLSREAQRAKLWRLLPVEQQSKE